ncbi:MAG: NYN domain-containing protein, partial [Cyanobacteria bacterium J06555_13]
LTPDALDADLSMSDSISEGAVPESGATDNTASQDNAPAVGKTNASQAVPQTIKPRARRTRSSVKSSSTASSEETTSNHRVVSSASRQSKVAATADSEMYSPIGSGDSFRGGVDQFRGVTESTNRMPNRSPGFQVYQPGQHNGDRIAIFIDGSNLFYAASHLNIEVDYRRLLTTLVRGRRLLRAYFYTGVDPQNEKQRGFLLWLNRHGHRVVSKELAHMPDGSRKANMHVEMAVDMMRIAEYCSTLTLLGGDGNLAYALQVLSQRGTSIEVVSLQSMTSDSLIDLADSYTDLADLRDEIKR